MRLEFLPPTVVFKPVTPGRCAVVLVTSCHEHLRGRHRLLTGFDGGPRRCAKPLDWLSTTPVGGSMAHRDGNGEAE